MPGEYPYTLAVDKFKEFLGKLKAQGVPARVDETLLKAMGYTSSNHRSFPRVLKFVDLVDSKGVPTGKYTALREGDAGEARVASFIRDAYSTLFDLYPDAHRKDTEALRNFFRANTKVGERAVEAMASTFQALCELGAFGGEPAARTKADDPASVVRKPDPAGPSKGAARVNRQPVTFNINIQLQIPPTTDAQVYEALFSSMATHILRLEETED